MKQREINRAVAAATGDDLETIVRIGFLIAEPDASCEDLEGEELGGHVIDWDQLAHASAFVSDPECVLL